MKRYRTYSEGMKIRRKACKYTAIVLSTRKDDDDMVPLAFSLAVFFEAYMFGGANATAKDFGPKKPAKLKVAKL